MSLIRLILSQKTEPCFKLVFNKNTFKLRLVLAPVFWFLLYALIIFWKREEKEELLLYFKELYQKAV